MDCRVRVPTGDWWLMKGRGGGQIGGGGLSLSQESVHDLALMVSDFLENGSGGTESWCSSDGDSSLSDLSLLPDKIPWPAEWLFCNCEYDLVRSTIFNQRPRAVELLFVCTSAAP